MTALVGPNGAGKTTLLLVLATLLVPDAEQVTVAGFDPVMQADEVRAQMGWAPDVFGLYDNLTCREYLVVCGEAMRLAAAKARTRAWELLGVASLTEQADQPVHTLSRSQKQRLGLTRSRLRNHMPSRTRAIEHPVTRPSHSVTQALAGFVRCRCAIRASPRSRTRGVGSGSVCLILALSSLIAAYWTSRAWGTSAGSSGRGLTLTPSCTRATR